MKKRILTALLALALAAGLTVPARAAGEQAMAFTDVARGDWFYAGVKTAFERGYVNGVTATSFQPRGTADRAMVVTILYRMAGKPAGGAAPFTDVPRGAWYADAVAWAAGQGVVEGYGDGTFRPLRAINREEMATLLYRYADKCLGKGYGVGDYIPPLEFDDAGAVSNFAYEAMCYLVEGKMVNGSDGHLDPKGNATRAQLAALLVRFADYVA